ncbi:MAG: DUF6431 domain-containing protein [Clostridiales bacterium]|nr:DUF6431 domain-containing protein [Clostridiales bacterium]
MVFDNESTCPDCGGALKYYDSVYRIVRTKRRDTRWVKIHRLRCYKCGRIHRALPDYILPYKQYETDVILGVCEGLITRETLGFEDYPCELTMARWRAQKDITRNLHGLL